MNWPIARGRYGGIDRSGRGRELVEEPSHARLDLRLELRGRLLRRLRPRQAGGHRPVADHHTCRARSSSSGATGRRPHVGQDAHRQRRPVPGTDGRGVLRQPARLQLDPALRNQDVKQYWYPIRELGGIKKANLDAAVNLEVDEKTCRPLSAVEQGEAARSFAGAAKVLLKAGEQVLFEKEVAISPKSHSSTRLPLPAGREGRTT